MSPFCLHIQKLSAKTQKTPAFLSKESTFPNNFARIRPFSAGNKEMAAKKIRQNTDLG